MAAVEESFVVDLDDLELGEIEEFEESMGCSLAETDLNSAKALVRLIWITKKRDDPKFTLDKARKVKLSQLGDGEDEGPPTPAKPRSKRAANGTQ